MSLNGGIVWRGCTANLEGGQEFVDLATSYGKLAFQPRFGLAKRRIAWIVERASHLARSQMVPPERATPPQNHPTLPE